MKIAAFQPVYCSGMASSHTCVELCEHMISPDSRVRLLTPSGDRLGKPFISHAIPRLVSGLLYRRGVREASMVEYAAKKFVRSLRKGEVAYLWPGSPHWMYQAIKQRGHAIVMERINCHRATAKRILDEEYARLGLAPTHGLTDDAANAETTNLQCADFVFSPAPNVRQSLLAAGIAQSKIIDASYGWDPARVRTAQPLLPPADGPSFIFLGRVCVRKGAHLLLDSWARASCRGRLILAGAVDDEIRSLRPEQISLPSVAALGHRKEIAPILASSQVMAFPTLEEGSALVIYEAMAAGIPIITTPMGAGEVVRDGKDGIIIDARDTDSWVRVFRELSSDPGRIAAMSASARSRAAEFTWQKAGQRRAQALARKVQTPGP